MKWIERKYQKIVSVFFLLWNLTLSSKLASSKLSFGILKGSISLHCAIWPLTGTTLKVFWYRSRSSFPLMNPRQLNPHKKSFNREKSLWAWCGKFVVWLEESYLCIEPFWFDVWNFSIFNKVCFGHFLIEAEGTFCPFVVLSKFQEVNRRHFH